MSSLLWTIIGAYLVLIVLMHIPSVQSFIGLKVAQALSEKFATKVTVTTVDLGFLNRLIVDGVSVYDQQGAHMLDASRISAKFGVMALAKGQIEISSAQLFGLKANIYKKDETSKPNFQFIIDSLASKDTTKHSPLNLKINSLIIRNGELVYHQQDKPYKSGIDVNHIHVADISGHIIFNAIKEDSININLKSLSFKKLFNVDVNRLSLKFVANRKAAKVTNLKMVLPHSTLHLPSLEASYTMNGKQIEMPSLYYSGQIEDTEISTADIKSILPKSIQINNEISLSCSFNGRSTSLIVNKLNIFNSNNSLRLDAHGSISDWDLTPRWIANISELQATAEFIHTLLSSSKIEKSPITRLGNINFRGNIGGYGKDVAIKGNISTGVGNANLAVGKHKDSFTARINTKGIRLDKILDNPTFGTLVADIDVDGKLHKNDFSLSSVKAYGDIPMFTYKGYTYKNIHLNGLISNIGHSISKAHFAGEASINDANIALAVQGNFSPNLQNSTALHVNIRHFNPRALHLSDIFGKKTLALDLDANFKGHDINNAIGDIDVSNVSISSSSDTYNLNNLHIQSSNIGANHAISLTSDFANFNIEGKYTFQTLISSLANQFVKRIPDLKKIAPSIFKYANNSTNNNFRVNGTVTRTDWLQELLNIPLDAQQPLTIDGIIDDRSNYVDLKASFPHIIYDGQTFQSGKLNLLTTNDTLKADLYVDRLDDTNKLQNLHIQANAASNNIGSVISYADNNATNPLKGDLKTDMRFFLTEEGKTAVHVNVHPSEIHLGDSIWRMQPSDIIYTKDRLLIDHFAVHHSDQHFIVSGIASKNAKDSLSINLQDVDVAYILSLVNFHAVEFSGKASGIAHISGAFSQPEANAHLLVNDFEFQKGRMGNLDAHVNWNKKMEQIDIDAIANDTPNRKTYIQGYVSPARNYINLDIQAQNTRLAFLQDFCDAFMEDVDGSGSGKVRVYGDLKKINLIGKVVADGSLKISSLNTTYSLQGDTVTFLPNQIVFQNDTIHDKDGNVGILNGALYHNYLKDLSYDINVKANNLLCYDTHEFGENSFYGTAYATGTCQITGKSGELNIDVDATPEKGSQIVYNMATTDNISNQQFIHWNVRNDSLAGIPGVPLTIAIPKVTASQGDDENPIDIPTDIHINMLLNCTPDATLKLLDEQTGDYIALNGNGGLRATYYNKGSFDLYGNYIVDHGVYKLTIQNVIKKDFLFQQGGTITFGGDPYNAALRLKALYAVNGVSLSDLNIGRSFTSNNIRVDCLMDITGTPQNPKVDFSLDLPTVNADAKQMVYSLINSEEEMNQQVLYLLAIGRFYSQENNNSSTENAQYSQTSLAMQSILSGTLSQQLNNVLSSVINNTNWNVGANISTGDEGFNNAEYEGLLSGRLLNNRLLINGQFGYRDNANATTSFIGDFDVRYLIFPSGNIQVRMYNQTNDRYFTKNSLNTQGIGLILKKDFNGIGDLFGRKKRKTTHGGKTKRP